MSAWLVYAAAGGALVVVVAVMAALRRARVTYLVGMLIAALPLFHTALVWLRLVPEAYLRLGRPLLTPLCFAVVAFAAWRSWLVSRSVGRVRQALQDVFTIALLLVLSLAAMRPELGRPIDSLAVLVVVDRSRSIDLVPDAETRIDRELAAATASMRDEDRIGTVVFAAQAVTEDPPHGRDVALAPQRADVGRDGTDIAMGLRRALADVPPDSAARLVLVSDGVATRGDALAAAAAAVAGDIPIDVLPLEQRKLPDIRVADFRVTPRASEGESLDMRLVVASPTPADLEIRLKRDGELIHRIPARVEAGEDVLRLREPAPASGLHRYDVEITAADPSLDSAPDDNTASAFVRVRGPAYALVLDGDEGATAMVASALTDAGFRVRTGGPTSVPADIGEMATYDLIVMGDVAARLLAPSQIDALASYVRDLGGGLFLLGGDRSMGPGGYAGSPLEDVSPVSFDLKQERRRASLAEVIAIDISGSMGMEVGGKTKLELANEAAARSANLLGPGDHLGVVAVDTIPYWAVRLAPVSDKAAIEKAIRSVAPGGGGIYVDVALAEAYGALRPAKVNLKHVLLFADGSDAENITPAVNAAVAQAFKNGITTSCVSLGRGMDLPALERISQLGGGRFYIVEDASRLPAVFTQETILASRSALVEKPFRVAPAAGGSIMQGVDVGVAPPLEGYVVTIAKGRSTVMLTGPDDDPILASWAVGVGRSVAFTSDLKDRWGTAWTHWPGAARLVAQAGRYASRGDDDRRVRLEADTSRGQLHVRATVVDDDGRTASFRRLRLRVSGPDGFQRELPLEAAGAGTYTANVPLSRPGSYIAVAMDEAGERPVATTGAVLTAGEELRPTGSDLALLARIAEISGGRKRDTLAGVFHDRGGLRFNYRDVTLPLLIAATVLLWLMVAARRLSLPEGLGRRLVRVLAREDLEPAPAPATGMSVATLDHLVARQERTRSRLRADDVAAAREATAERRATEATPGVAGARQPRPKTGATTPAPTAGSTAERLAKRRRDRREGAAATTRKARGTAKKAGSEPKPATPAKGGKSAAEILLERRRKRR